MLYYIDNPYSLTMTFLNLNSLVYCAHATNTHCYIEFKSQLATFQKWYISVHIIRHHA